MKRWADLESEAPELAAGTVTPAADVYALGAFLNAMLHGGPGLSPEALDLIGKAMSPSVEARYPTPSEFYAAVEKLPGSSADPAPAAN